MEIKELKALLKLLREQGVQQYVTPELSLVIDLQEIVGKRQQHLAKIEDIEDDPISEEEAERLLFYSATPPPVPEDN
jgi:hypothetical protein